VFGVALLAGRAMLVRLSRRPPPPPPDARLSSALAGALARLAPRARAAFAREIALLLRFVFVRVDLVYVAAAAVAAFVFGLPFTLLSLPFLWLSVMINFFGPDQAGGAMTRYALAGYPLRRVLFFRHMAVLLLTTLTVALAAAAVALFGAIRVPSVGPPTYWMYPLFFGYGLTLLLLLSVGADRYSLRYPDPIAMRMLFPTRTKTSGAAAGVLALLLFIATAAGATLVFLVVWAALGAAPPVLTPMQRLVAAVVGASAVNLGLYAYSLHAHARAGR
jgi:hypothetical protein